MDAIVSAFIAIIQLPLLLIELAVDLISLFFDRGRRKR
jgi:hypothetical protein